MLADGIVGIGIAPGSRAPRCDRRRPPAARDTRGTDKVVGRAPPGGGGNRDPTGDAVAAVVAEADDEEGKVGKNTSP